MILAEEAGTLEDQVDYYAQGVHAGERALGSECFAQNVGHFWGITATRPYMRARFGLAESLTALGRTDEAIEHYQELLRLNPNDNQGVRYVLMPKLLATGRDVEAARLLKSSDEESANWAYARALLAFRLSGRSAAASRELRQAIRVNPHVPELLCSDKPLPHPRPYSPGSFEEAVNCAVEMQGTFQATVGALDWVADEQRRRDQELDRQRRERRRKEHAKQKKRKRK